MRLEGERGRRAIELLVCQLNLASHVDTHAVISLFITSADPYDMILHRHSELNAPSPFPGVARMITMDKHLGAGAITQGIVTMQPGTQSRPHTHQVEESMMLLQGHVRILIGREVTEVREPATFLAPANIVHSIRNVGSEPAVICIAYPSVNVETHFVDGVEF